MSALNETQTAEASASKQPTSGALPCVRSLPSKSSSASPSSVVPLSTSAPEPWAKSKKGVTAWNESVPTVSEPANAQWEKPFVMLAYCVALTLLGPHSGRPMEVSDAGSERFSAKTQFTTRAAEPSSQKMPPAVLYAALPATVQLRSLPVPPITTPPPFIERLFVIRQFSARPAATKRPPP